MQTKILFRLLTPVLSLFLTVGVSAQTRKPSVSVKAAPAARSVTIVTEPKSFVWLNNIRRGTTDADGRLKIEKLAAGKNTLRIRARGFAEKTVALTPAQRGEIKIALTATTDEAELAFQEAEELRESGSAENRRKAVELYKQALAKKPKFIAAQIGLARVYYDMREMDNALAEIEKARKMQPGVAEASTIEGRVYLDESDTENAVKAFRRAIREAKNFDPEAHVGLARAYKEQEQLDQAATELKVALAQLADSEPVIYQMLGETYERMRKNKEAIAAYEKFVQLAPAHREAPAVRSIIDQLKKQNDGETLELMPQ